MKTSELRHLDWNLLRVFSEIARVGGVSEAARKMGRKQPAVSLALKRLEEHLGVKLCDRGPGGFRLSDEGEFIADVTGRMMQLVDEIPGRITQLSELVSGTIRIMVISNVVDDVLDTSIESFHRKYPAVELQVEVATWDVVSRAVLRGNIDIGVAAARHFHGELHYDLLCQEIHRPYCGPTHPCFGKTYKTPKEIADQSFVLTGADEPDDVTRFRLQFGLGKHRTGISDHLEEAKRLAIMGVGICFLPEKYAQRDVDRGRLWPMLDAAFVPKMDLYVITNPFATRHRARQLFSEELLRQMTERPVSGAGRDLL